MSSEREVEAARELIAAIDSMDHTSVLSWSVRVKAARDFARSVIARTPTSEGGEP